MELFALVIDAGAQERRVLQRALSYQGWKVTEAASIEEAIGGINRHAWKLVFCDAHLSTHRIEKILSLYARGMTTREIQQHIEEIYKVEVSPTLISNVTEAVMEDVVAWQNRPMEAIYPILYMDALQVKIRDGAHVVNKAVHLAIGVTLAGNKDVLGIWLGQSEGAKLWLQIVTELNDSALKVQRFEQD